MPKSTAKTNVAKRKKASVATNRGQKKGQGAIKAGTALPHSSASSKIGRTAPNGGTNLKGSNYRTENTIKRLQMYNKRPNVKKMKEQSNKPVRIQPDRRWFGNTRVIAQDKMQSFRETLSKGVEDSYSVVLKSSKLPMSLLRDTEGKSSRMNLLSISPFSQVFGKKQQQKKAKLSSYDMEGLLKAAEDKAEVYDHGKKDTRALVDPSTGLERIDDGVERAGHFHEEIFDKGTSRRIWAELYKVVDSSDVLVEVLDARDPMGTRCLNLERDIRKNRPHKHIVLVLNKVDLVPTWVSRRWIQVLMKDYPTIAFHASITNPFGKNSLMNLLRQFGTLMSDKKHVTVGMIGYPNVGKSSVINTLRRKKVCKAAPVPGETKVWQYISMSKRIYLLDCPGIVPPSKKDFDADCAKVLKGVVRAERVKQPADFIDEVLSRVKRPYLIQRYKLLPDTSWEESEDFLTIIAKKMGKLLKGGDPDIDTAARIVLYDWQRGRIPYFTAPPDADGVEAADVAAAPAAVVATGGSTEQQPLAVADGSAAMPPEGSSEAAATASSSQPASSSATAAPEATGEPLGPEEPMAAATATAMRQCLNDLSCSLEYDEEDRRGEAAPVVDPAVKTGVKRRRESSKAEASKAAAASSEATKGQGGKKRRRKTSGGSSGAGTSDGRRAGPLKQGSVDWKAVVAEFGV